MPRLRRYHIFISHAWTYDEHHRIVSFLEETPNFFFANYSVPYDNQLNYDSESELEVLLQNLIKPVHIVLVPAGMEINYRRWIQFELDYAQKLEKPIVAIAPRGQQRFPKVIEDARWPMVKWNRKSIVKAVRLYSLR